MTDEELNQIEEARDAVERRAYALLDEAEKLRKEAAALHVKADIADDEAKQQFDTARGYRNVLKLLGD